MLCLSVSGAVHVFPTVGYSKVLWESENTTLVIPVVAVCPGRCPHFWVAAGVDYVLIPMRGT